MLLSFEDHLETEYSRVEQLRTFDPEKATRSSAAYLEWDMRVACRYAYFFDELYRIYAKFAQPVPPCCNGEEDRQQYWLGARADLVAFFYKQGNEALFRVSFPDVPLKTFQTAWFSLMRRDTSEGRAGTSSSSSTSSCSVDKDKEEAREQVHKYLAMLITERDFYLHKRDQIKQVIQTCLDRRRDEIEEYNFMGKKLVSTEEMKDFVELLRDVYGMNTNSKHFNCPDQIEKPSYMRPFVYVCGSVATGKTQLAFTLSNMVPMLYLTDGRYSHPLRELFSPTMGLFKFFFDRDRRAVSEWFGYRELDKHDTLEQCLKQKWSFWMLGFIYSLWREMVQIVKNRKCTWMEAQLQVDVYKLECEPLKIEACNERLDELFKDFNVRPVLVYDEPYKGGEGVLTNGKFCLLRMLNLQVVLLGYNKFLLPKTGTSYKPKLDCSPFCVMFTRLPGYPQDVLACRLEDIERSVRVMGDSLPIYQDRIDLLDMVRRCITGERPGFINYIINNLRSLIVDPNYDDPECMLQSLIHTLFTKNDNRMASREEFYYGQLWCTGRRNRLYWCNAADHLGFVCEHRHGFETDGWHRHVPAYDQHVTRFAMTLTYKANEHFPLWCVYKLSDGRIKYGEYRLFEVWARFKDEPLATLAFCSSPHSGPYRRCLTLRRYDRELQLAQVVHIICQEVSRGFLGGPYYNSATMCLLGRAGLVHSLSAGGFRGQTGDIWLPRFISLMAYEEILWDDSNQIKQSLKSLKVPFCGPVEEPWNDKVCDYVTKNCSGFLGLIKESEWGIDLRIDSLETAKTLMQAECMTCDIFPYKLMAVLWELLRNRDSKLDVIIGLGLNGMGAMVKKLEDADWCKDLTVIYMTRERERSVTIRHLYGNGARHVILIPFHELSR